LLKSQFQTFFQGELLKPSDIIFNLIIDLLLFHAGESLTQALGLYNSREPGLKGLRRRDWKLGKGHQGDRGYRVLGGHRGYQVYQGKRLDTPDALGIPLCLANLDDLGILPAFWELRAEGACPPQKGCEGGTGN
jgi:hypothetical protein